MRLSDKTLLMMDRGAYAYMAEFMARYYGHVFYHNITGGPYPESPLCEIGKGLDGVEWIANPWKLLRKFSPGVDLVFYPDVHDSDQQETLLDWEIPVCGCLGASKMELDKGYFKDVCKDEGLPFQPWFYEAEGLDDLWECVKNEPGPLYLKSLEPYRGDWETKKHMNRFDTKLFLNRKRFKLGEERAKTIRIGVEKPIESACEIGIDNFRFNGTLIMPTGLGYEIKDEGILEKIFEELPEVLQEPMDGLEGEYDRLGCQGPYSSEIRIAEDGTAYPIDETNRCASPATACLMEMYGEEYAKAVYALAHGELPEIQYEYEHAAEIILSSMEHIDNELHVGFPKECSPYVKLRNCHKDDGEYYCVPNGDEGTFGSVVGVGHSMKEAIEMALEIAEQLDVYRLDYRKDVFDEAEEVVEKGVSFGIQW